MEGVYCGMMYRSCSSLAGVLRWATEPPGRDAAIARALSKAREPDQAGQEHGQPRRPVGGRLPAFLRDRTCDASSASRAKPGEGTPRGRTT